MTTSAFPAAPAVVVNTTVVTPAALLATLTTANESSVLSAAVASADTSDAACTSGKSVMMTVTVWPPSAYTRAGENEEACGIRSSMYVNWKVAALLANPCFATVTSTTPGTPPGTSTVKRVPLLEPCKSRSTLAEVSPNFTVRLAFEYTRGKLETTIVRRTLPDNPEERERSSVYASSTTAVPTGAVITLQSKSWYCIAPPLSHETRPFSPSATSGERTSRSAASEVACVGSAERSTSMLSAAGTARYALKRLSLACENCPALLTAASYKLPLAL
mmetsp:Transcript_64475/g.154206  ORF Transcript_64475/g.154206 Transcript_64475/m.154206 type:complete len:275 (-) Transcript_64475:10-834(-)